MELILLELIDLFKKEYNSKPVTLTYDNQYGDVTILADEYSITQSLSHLIDNAIKFNDKGIVRVTLYKDEHKNIKIDIADNGIGMSDEFSKHLFEPYTQEATGYGRIYEGVGVGLSLVKKFLELNNAQISVKSRRNEGTTFTINITNLVVDSKKKSDIITQNDNNTEKDIPDPKKKDRLKVYTILLVEDEAMNRFFVNTILKEEYNILSATSAEESDIILKENKVDIILMDISIKGEKNGIIYTKELKSSKEFSHIPIIIVSAHTFESDKKNSLESGCNDFLTKPFTQKDLLKIIRKFLR